jgi:amino acid permease
MTAVERFRSMPWPRKLAFGLIMVAGFGIMIAYITLITVTLRKAFELATPWETVQVFLIVTVALAVLARVSGLHETR